MCNKVKTVTLTFFGEKHTYYKECELHKGCDKTVLIREYTEFD